MRIQRTLLIGAAGLSVLNGLSASPILRDSAVFRPVESYQGMVASAEKHATEVGLAVLERGGNAIDAGVAMGFTLAVTLPRAGNLGGGGFMLIHEASSGETFALDYRETAPAAASRDMFLDQEGHPDPYLSRDSPLSVGVPGSVAGLLTAHERFGSLPLAELMQPAIDLARDGFAVSPGLSRSLLGARLSGRLKPRAIRTYFKADGSPFLPGEKLLQPELAATLERVAQHGRDGFYAGPIAASIVRTLQQNGGLMTLEDLQGYQPVWRKPVTGHFRDCQVRSMPPPSSGGVHLIQMLQFLEAFPLREWGHNSAQSVHHITEVMKRAYADRSQYLGDPDFEDVPEADLLSESYKEQILKAINPHQPTPSEDIHPGTLPGAESSETTHFSVVDNQGNAVSNTTTLNFSYGSGIMTDQTGILLNNEMDDFSAKPGTPNAYGLLGGEANAIKPGKRMLSSMTPTIVLRDGQVHIVTGSPGGSRIINTVLQVLLNIIEFQMNPAEATHAARFHHQWFPDILHFERGFPVDTRRILREMGYHLEQDSTIGNSQTIVVEGGVLWGSADPRRDDGMAAGY